MDTTPHQETTPNPAPETPSTLQEQASAALLPTVPFYKKRSLMASILVAVIILAGAGYYVYSENYKGGGVVAVVNGTKIYRDSYNESVALIEQSATLQGMDLADEATREAIRTQALDVLINNTLLLSGAEEAGITATDADVQVKYDELIAQYENAEELSARMAEIGLTEEKLRSNIRERIIADKFIESVTDIETLAISEVEIAAFVSAIESGGQKLPPLEEIRPQIEAELLGKKRQEIIVELITKLKEQGTVDVRM